MLYICYIYKATYLYIYVYNHKVVCIYIHVYMYICKVLYIRIYIIYIYKVYTYTLCHHIIPIFGQDFRACPVTRKRMWVRVGNVRRLSTSGDVVKKMEKLQKCLAKWWCGQKC